MSESMDLIEKRHKQEVRDLEGKVRALMKTAKKSNRAVIETEAIQMGYDLKARHLEELENPSNIEAVDATLESLAIAEVIIEETDDMRRRRIEEETVMAKKAKSQKKKDKKSSKDEERELKKEEINSTAGPSLRTLELDRINHILAEHDLTVKLIASDGHCLYRAIADQLNSLWLHAVPNSNTKTDNSEDVKHDFIQLRTIASTYLRSHADEFAPFLGMLPTDSEYGAYCNKVESVGDAEWGGQLEIKALCSSLNRTMMIYSADAPVVIMGEENLASNPSQLPLKLAYHRHFYALGEHYNSVAPIVGECACCSKKEGVEGAGK